MDGPWLEIIILSELIYNIKNTVKIFYLACSILVLNFFFSTG